MTASLTKQTIKRIRNQYQRAKRRLFCLDYDGTLVDFAPTPPQATPTPELLALVRRLASDPANTVVIVSGRDKRALQEWLGDLRVGLSAEHGQFTREVGGQWRTITPIDPTWKISVRNVMKTVVRALPQSFIEEKETALCLHYRLSPSGVAKAEVARLQKALADKALVLLPGDKVLEVRGSNTTKGGAIQQWATAAHDFALIAGDDTTDESMFTAAQPGAITIKVRPGPTAAAYTLLSPAELLACLADLLE